MATYPSITDKVCAMVRGGEIKFVSARVECNPETGAKRPYEVIKTTACGRDFRATSWASMERAQQAADHANAHYAVN